MGTMTASGWYMCPTALTGKYFGIYSTTVNVNFFEAMAFSQEAIQINAYQTNTYKQVTSSPSTNALKNLFSLLYDTGAVINSSVIAAPQASGANAQFSIHFRAEVMIEGIVLLPGYVTANSNLPQIQKNVKVYIRAIISQDFTYCGIFADYYTKYGEIKCGLAGNEIQVRQQIAKYSMQFQAIGVLSNCDCALTSFNPALFYSPQTTALISAATLTKILGDTTAQTITISTVIYDTVSQVCSNADGVTKCGLRTIKFFDSTNTQITTQPYRGLSWNALFVLTLAGSYQVVGKFTIDIEISLTAYPAVTYRQTLTVAIITQQCLIPLGLLNLLNTSAIVSQNALYPGYSQTPSSGCDGVVLYTPNGVQDLSKVQKSNTPTPTWWRAEFLAQTSIRAFLVINYQKYALKIQETAATIGDNQDVTLNKYCKGFGSIIDGGWWSCDAVLLGKFFGFFSNTDYVHFVEVMAFSQEVIQLNALSATLSSEDSTYPARNALQNLVVTYGAGQKCMKSTPTTDPSFTLTLKASGMIEGVILLPGDYLPWSSYHKDVGVFVEDTYGTQRQCGANIQDYNTYSEAYCGFIGIKVIAKKFGQNQVLAMCGFGALSSCDCKLTSFDPKLMPNTIDTFIQGNTTIQAIASENAARNLTISLNQFDTVSSICGLADGLTSCGQRTLTFVDKLSGLTISQWPYKGFQWDQPTLSFTPNLATQTITVLTVTLGLLQYPNATRKQDITAITLTAKAAQLARDATLNVTIGIAANFTLPLLPSQLHYIIVSTQNFTVEVNGNVVSVLCRSDSEIGVKQVQIQAVDSTDQPIFSGALKVIFVRSEPATYLEPENAFSEIAEQALLKKDTSCISCGQPKPAIEINHPIMTVTKVDHHGFFSLKFNQRMNFTSIFVTINTTNAGLRNLKDGRGGTIAIDGESTIDKYLLSAKHLKIEIISGRQVNQTMLDFDWQTFNINETQIDIQLLFVHPAWISSQKGEPEVMRITLLEPSENAFRSLENGQNINDPLQSVSKVLPTQVQLGRAIQSLQSISEIAETGGKTAVILQVLISLLLSSALTQMWTMVNGLQILLTFPLMNVPIPANVYIILSKLNKLNSFDVLGANQILLSMFTFSDTDLPGFGFQQMGVTSKRLILYLEMIFFFILAAGALIVLYTILWLLRGYWKPINRLRLKIGRFLYWNFCIRLVIEGCLDLAIGILLSFQDRILKLPSDIFDFVLSLVFSPIIFGLPVASYYYLTRNATLLQDEKFEIKFGALWEGYKIGTDQERRGTIIMITWFITRRLLLAVVVSELQLQTLWLQVSFNLWLILLDVWMKIWYDPFVSREGGILERFNDLICLVLSYFMFLFTDFVPDPDTKYMLGWGFNGLVGLMLSTNVFLISLRSFQLIASNYKRYLAIKHNKYVMEMKGIELISEKPKMRKVSDFFKISDLIYLDAAYGSESSSDQESEEVIEKPTAIQVVNLESQLVDQTPYRKQRHQIVEEVKEQRPKYTTLSGDNLVQRRKERIERVKGILPILDLSVEGRLDDFVDLLPSNFSEHSPITREKDVKFMADLLQSESEIVQENSVKSLSNRPKEQSIYVDIERFPKQPRAPLSFEVSAELLTKQRPSKEALIFDANEVIESRQTASTKMPGVKDDFDL